MKASADATDLRLVPRDPAGERGDVRTDAPDLGGEGRHVPLQLQHGRGQRAVDVALNGADASVEGRDLGRGCGVAAAPQTGDGQEEGDEGEGGGKLRHVVSGGGGGRGGAGVAGRRAHD